MSMLPRPIECSILGHNILNYLCKKNAASNKNVTCTYQIDHSKITF